MPAIETLYNDATAPGLSHQPGFIQFTEGVRIKPSIGDLFQLNYLATFQQFVAPSDSSNSFLRWTVDLNHTLSLYRTQNAVVRNSDRLGPDHWTRQKGTAPAKSASSAKLAKQAGRRGMSAAARKRMSEMMKARWAARKKAAK